MLEHSYQAKDTSYYGYSRSEMHPFVPVGIKRMLDIGCGRGNFARYYRETAGVETWGIEMMPDAAAEAKSILHHVLCGEFGLLSPSLPSGHFDVITCNDVLEHMIDPDEALRQMHRLLAPDGRIVASIPNVLFWPNLRELLVTRDWRYRDAGILDRTHLRFFTLKSIVRLFEQCGYVVERIEGINPYTGPAKFRMARKLLGRRMDDFAFPQFAVVASCAGSIRPSGVVCRSETI
jgi:SAM-dependent methyltransferase